MAERLRVERSTVARWERGTSLPQPWLRPRIAAALGLSPEQLDDLLVEPPAAGQPVGRDLQEVHDVKRRDLLRTFSMAGALLAVQGESLDEDQVDAVRRNAADLADHAVVNGYLWRSFTSTPIKAELLPAVLAHVDVLASALRQVRGEATHRQLCRLAADVFQLAGEIYFDANRYTEAAHHYSLAASAAERSGDFDLWTCALTRHAYISLYEWRFDRAEPMLELASGLAKRGDGALSTRYWVSVVRAQSFAGLGDVSACQRMLDDAERVRNLSGQIHNGGWLRFDGSRLAEERGGCYAVLGRLNLAEAELGEALSGDLTPRRRAGVLVDLATLGARSGDLDRVATYVDAAITMALRTGSGVISRKLQSLRPYLAPLLKDDGARRLDARIAEVAGHRMGGVGVG